MTMATSTPSLQDNLAFIYTMLSTKSHNPEAAAQDIWQTIVPQWFTPSEGYRWAMKAPNLTNNKTPDSTVIQVIQVIEIPAVSFECIEHPIFIVVCKHSCSDNDTPLDWDETMQVEFIHRISENSNSGTERMFGAVAIGKKAKFYRFDRKAQPDQRLAGLHEDVFDLEKVDGSSQVEGTMNYIKTNAWKWVTG
ncbi:Cytochrome b5 [Penicillium coprophilum]|uniref:Cytochrome b5 n=1 Tax=Penicillium coprophilum TaxID=36646 RepID=UPI002387AD46|nr:Cytochrome b5 [Penicillium coprophilum]KAJ5177851.1 Cytochrome b5 [Penicillium coprophilum]